MKYIGKLQVFEHVYSRYWTSKYTKNNFDLPDQGEYNVYIGNYNETNMFKTNYFSLLMSIGFLVVMLVGCASPKDGVDGLPGTPGESCTSVDVPEGTLIECGDNQEIIFDGTDGENGLTPTPVPTATPEPYATPQPTPIPSPTPVPTPNPTPQPNQCITYKKCNKHNKCTLKELCLVLR